jgi:hypothetical protein
MRAMWLFFCVLITIPSLTKTYAQVAPLTSGKFKEHYSSDVPISGKVLVGILIESSNKNSGFFVRSNLVNTLFCFRVMSIDGTYASENEYVLNAKAIDASEQGLVEVEYPTQFQKILNDFEDYELALLATEGECDSSGNVHYFATKDQVQNNDKIRFLISSARSQVFMRLKSKEHSLRPSCTRIEEGKRTAYDTICEISLTSLTSADYIADIVRRKSNRKLPDTNFNLSVVQTDD